VDWIQLAHDNIRRMALLNMATYLRVR